MVKNDTEHLEGHMNIMFLIHHGVLVREIEIERLCVANCRERFDYSLSAPPPPISAALVADVRHCLSAETGGILPSSSCG